jgi:hypothetical protein
MREKKPSIRIHKIPVKGDYWGRALSRPLRSDMVQESLRRCLGKADNFLLLSLETLHRKSYALDDLRTVTAGLFQEGDYAYVFRVTLVTGGGRKAGVAMIVAKNGGGMSRLAMAEHENLKRLYERCKDIVVRPLEGGHVTVSGPRPARLYAYCSVWLNRFHELGVQHANMNFYVNELPFQYFDSATSDRIKGRMLELLFRLYDPGRQEAIEPPKVGAGDFMITRKDPQDLKLIACRRILKGVSLDRCFALYLGYSGAWGDRLFHFVPKETDLLRKALMEGLVSRHGFKADEVFLALNRYRNRLARSKQAREGWTPLPSLNKLLTSGW